MLNVLVLEENHLIAVGPHLSLDAIREDDLLLTAFVKLLPLAFLTDDLID